MLKRKVFTVTILILLGFLLGETKIQAAALTSIILTQQSQIDGRANFLVEGARDQFINSIKLDKLISA